MVTSTETQTVISTQIKLDVAQPSFKRWLKHSCYFKSSKRLFTLAQQEQIALAVMQAENGHYGEIQVIIEANLPSDVAYHYDTWQRAQYLFGRYRVWDTEHNSGLLIYLNLCAHQVELVADRGIHQAVLTETWQTICSGMLPYFKQQQYTEGLCAAITALGEVLQDFYQDQVQDDVGDELSNLPRLL